MGARPILLVDDDIQILKVYKKILQLNGFDVSTASNAFDAVEAVSREKFAVAICDIIMPKMSGMELLNEIKALSRDTEVIMLTAEGSISGAVEAVKHGAYSYLVKPVEIDELIGSIRKAEEVYNLKDENRALRMNIEENKWNIFIGQSEKAKLIKEQAQIIGKSDSSVLISGESGTGKEVIANLIHMSSPRSAENFVCVNCGIFNENLIETELFGSEKGAYTGADKTHIGRFERADGGTLFFDEIGELSLNMQVKLLRVLQEKTFERVGGERTISSDFRLITATNRDLKEEVRKGNFREDLYYRINIIPLEMPPLRERKEDIPLLFHYFVSKFSADMNKSIKHVNEDLLIALRKYDWPGNVRELRNITERLVVLSLDGILNKGNLPTEIKNLSEDDVLENMRTDDKSMPESYMESKNKFEMEYILGLLAQHDWNIAATARIMGISRKTLYQKMNKYNIMRDKAGR